MQTALVFQNTQFDIVDRNNQPWLRSQQIAVALGYGQANRVADIYARHADEFTDQMTAVVKLQDLNPQSAEAGQMREVRIFSLRGAHLLAMLSRTAVAKEFRKWVLDILDTKVGTGETAVALPNAISREQAGELATLIAERFPNGQDRPYAWGRFNNHFRLASYKDLPCARFSEACAYIRGMPMKEAPALPAPAGHRPMKPPVVTKTAGSHTGATRNLNTVKQLINELQMWGYDELPRDVANAFHECLYELNALLITGWTEVDEALQCLHRAQRYLSRWQGSPL